MVFGLGKECANQVIISEKEVIGTKRSKTKHEELEQLKMDLESSRVSQHFLYRGREQTR